MQKLIPIINGLNSVLPLSHHLITSLDQLIMGPVVFFFLNLAHLRGIHLDLQRVPRVFNVVVVILIAAC